MVTKYIKKKNHSQAVRDIMDHIRFLSGNDDKEQNIALEFLNLLINIK